MMKYKLCKIKNFPLFLYISRTVCVIRGKVVTSKMDPLIGVRVSHENHLEEGFTLTRPNGLFDFVCNCNSSISVKLKFGRSPFPFVEKSFYAFSNMVSEKVHLL